MNVEDDRWSNEELHRQAKPHLKRLWGIVLCRLCSQVDPEHNEVWAIAGSAGKRFNPDSWIEMVEWAVGRQGALFVDVHAGHCGLGKTGGWPCDCRPRHVALDGLRQ